MAHCESPDTSIPLQTPSKSPRWALESHFRELMINPREDPGSTSISMWTPPPEPVPREGPVAKDKALPRPLGDSYMDKVQEG